MTTPLCILLVDDSEFFLTLCRQFLKNTPATILAANEGSQALQLVRDSRPNLVYMDLDMPGMDGSACCRALKQDPDLRDIPVIMIGDSRHPAARSLAEAAGCDGYLEKPLDRRLFLEAGHSFLFGIERREPRKPLAFPVELIARGETRKVFCRDISTGGMFVTGETELAEGSRVLLQFVLPGRAGERFAIKGRIAWVNHAGRGRKPDYPNGYGIEFVEISESVGAALRRCLGSA